MAPKKVLFVLTNVSKVPGTDKSIGWWLSEVAHPFDAIYGKAEIIFASPKGGLAPVDPLSIALSTDEASQKFLKEHKSSYKETEPLEKFLGRAGEFDAIFYPGGHGPMFDIATDPVSIELINEFASQNKVLSAVCHGPAAFVNVVLPSGKPLLLGKVVAGISNAEENSFQMLEYMPFPLETKLNEVSGGLYTAKDTDKKDATIVIEDNGKLITGQNPKSAAAVGKAILEAIGAGQQ